MFTLSTNIELPIAHRLPEAYSGLCVGNVDRQGYVINECPDLKVIHGHNYIVTFDISTNDLNEDFMVMDFKKVKKLIHQEMDRYDHSLILQEDDALVNVYKAEYLANGIDINKIRFYTWKQAPTAEYMAYKWYYDFRRIFESAGIKISKLVITVEETSHNKVSYTE